MSKHALDETDMPGYFLPEESQLRLARLSEYIKLLARLAQPRVPDGTRDGAPEVGVGELAFCFELLSDQVDLVLDEVSWPALRTDPAGAPEREAVLAPVPVRPDAQPADLVYGLTVDQLDGLDQLIQTIAAHGDVVAVNGGTDLARRTLPVLGQAILGAATGLREILDRVEAQRVRGVVRLRSGVDEPRLAYGTRRSPPVARGASASRPACSPVAHAGRPGGVRLH